MGLPPVLWLTDPRCQDSSTAGNKGARLAELTAKGYSVPPGFCITAQSLADGDSWRDAVAQAVRDLQPPWVARSSSSAEDSSGFAFPGVFTTVLGLDTTDALLAAVVSVRDSARGDTVERYAAFHGVVTASIQMAVVVQSLILATVAGVAFGRHPVTGADVVVIEGNYGLGEPVVDGSVTPDSVEVPRDGTPRVARIGSKRVKAVMNSGGLHRLPTTEQERQVCSIDLDLARAIAEVVRRLEHEFGGPQDVEWAAVNAELYVLQARPITSVSPSPETRNEN